MDTTTLVDASRLPPQRLEIGVGDLSCAGSAAPIASRIRRIPGVTEAVVNPITQRATITFDPGAVGAEEIVHQPFVALERTEHVDPAAGRDLRDGAQARVHAGAVSTAGENGDRFHRPLRYYSAAG